MKKYIGILFVLSLSVFIFGFPAFSSAQTADIDPNGAVSECVSLSSNLRYRDRDANRNGEVSTLQDFLQSKGYLNSEPTGYFGLLTVKAVKDFQNANGIIPPSGYVGPLTRTKIKALTCEGGVTTNPEIPVQIPTVSILPPGCLPNQNYSSTTGLACNGSQGTAFPPGCLSNTGYSTTTSQSCNGSTLQKGDVNGDGSINCTDVTWIQETVLNTRTLTTEQRARADVNGDGLVTTADITKLIQLHGLSCGTTTPATTLDPNPRIAYWGGKVGQHTDNQGNWISDPDGTSGVWDTDAGRLSYCKKWYPNTLNVSAYKTETITTWKRAKYYEQSNYTNTVMTYRCDSAVGYNTPNNSGLSSILGSSLQAGALGALDSTNNTNTNIDTTNTNINNVRVLVCAEWTKNLSKGMNDEEVRCLQQKLNEKGYKVAGTEGGKETTLFGWSTLVAVKAFQSNNGLVSDGIFGLQTYEVLN